jgi:hypothetical protein
MVSGLVTSPCDQLRIFSGDASMMRMASKSVMGLESSNGFERNKATLLGEPFGLPRLFPGFFDGPFLPGKRCLPLSRRTLNTVVSRQFSVRPCCSFTLSITMMSFADRQKLTTDN